MNSRHTICTVAAVAAGLAVGVMAPWGAPASTGAQAQAETEHDHAHEGGEAHGHDHQSEAGHEAHAHAEEPGAHAGHTHAEADGEAGHAHGAEEGHAHAHDEEGHGHEEIARLTPHELEEYGIQVAEAAPGELASMLRLPGEVVFNPDRVAHVMPRVPGVVRSVEKSVGDQVDAGELLAVLDSRALAQTKAGYLAAVARLELARSEAQRQETLFEQQITPERELLTARQALEEARIEAQLAERQLHALGLNEAAVAALPEQTDEAFTRYELRAPIRGRVIERHLVRGEVVESVSAEPTFIVADLSDVWVALTAYQRDLAVLREGQPVRITSNETGAEAAATIDYISPMVSEQTRTAMARVVLENGDGRWRPGTFVTGTVQTGATQGSVVVPRTALQTYEDQTVVFVQTEEGFEPRPVRVGRQNRTHAELAAGLVPGERYAATNPFVLKAELGKESFGGHGHAH